MIYGSDESGVMETRARRLGAGDWTYIKRNIMTKEGGGGRQRSYKDFGADGEGGQTESSRRMVFGRVGDTYIYC